MRYDSEHAAVVLSVGELCRYALHSGDLDVRMGGRFSSERARLGAEVHRRMQASAGASFSASCETLSSVPFSLRFSLLSRAALSDSSLTERLTFTAPPLRQARAPYSWISPSLPTVPWRRSSSPLTEDFPPSRTPFAPARWDKPGRSYPPSSPRIRR